MIFFLYMDGHSSHFFCTTQPYGWLPFIMSYILTLFKAYSTLYLFSHTHQHTSKYTTWHQSSLTLHLSNNLTFIQHGTSSHHKPQHTSNQAYHHITNPSIHLIMASLNILHHPRQQQNKAEKIGMTNKHRPLHVFQTFRHEIKYQTNILHH